MKWSQRSLKVIESGIRIRGIRIRVYYDSSARSRYKHYTGVINISGSMLAGQRNDSEVYGPSAADSSWQSVVMPTILASQSRQSWSTLCLPLSQTPRFANSYTKLYLDFES